MAREVKFLFSDNQDFANTTSTGEVSDKVYDMETLDGTVANFTDDQGIGYVNVTFGTVPAQATIVGTQGLMISVLTDSAAALATLPETCGAISILPSKIVAGAQFSIPFRMDILQKYLGVWVKAVSTSFVGTIYADIEISDHPVGENEGIQKMPS